ncbi:MAG: hypothetical protein D6804_03950 [Aquificota bacterium]|nr:MAG: hypothetical protein D6804_03950 [Aquificota bacterium]
MEDLTHLNYHSLSLVESYVVRKGKTYKRLQLKAFYTKNGKLRSKTIRSFKPENAPREIQTLIKLYRGIKHLSRAIDYLWGLSFFKNCQNCNF